MSEDGIRTMSNLSAPSLPPEIGRRWGVSREDRATMEKWKAKKHLGMRGGSPKKVKSMFDLFKQRVQR
jgi:hypothetical protein